MIGKIQDYANEIFYSYHDKKLGIFVELYYREILAYLFEEQRPDLFKFCNFHGFPKRGNALRNFYYPSKICVKENKIDIDTSNDICDDQLS